MADESTDRAGRYVSLPGRGRRGLMLRSRLYLGPDHLLSVEGNGFTESYKRFYFADIQGIVTRRTTRWIWSAAILFVFAAAVFFSVATLISGIGAYRLTLIGGLSLLPFAAVLLRGPTCICHIVTAVQKEQLLPLIRLRVARKAIGRIRAAVENAQGALTEEMREKLTVDDDDAGENVRRRSPSKEETNTLRHDSGVIHAITFSMVIATGLIWLANYSTALRLDRIVWANQLALGWLFFSPFTLVLLVVALVKQRRSDLARALRNITLFSFLFFAVFLCFQVFLPSFLLVARYTFLSVGGCLVLGAFGILSVLRHRKARKFPAENPVAPAEESLS
jgi:hypothetical protein